LRRLKAIAAHQDAEAAIEADEALEPLPAEVAGEEVADMDVGAK
jgi:DNA-directed RNA polymerase subunit beta'